MPDTDIRSAKTALKFWGHAAVSIYAHDGRSLLIDPHAPGVLNGALKYARIDEAHDWALATHNHADHSAFDAVVAEPIEPTTEAVGPFRIRRIETDHDEYGGRRFGGRVDIVEITVDSYRIVHLSDVGVSPSASELSPVRGADIVLAPIGGFYTMGAAQAEEWVRRIGAACVIPIHYKTDRSDLPIDPIDPFLTRFVEYFEHGSSFIRVGEALGTGSVIALKPAGSEAK